MCVHGPFLIEGAIWEFGHQNRKWRRTNSKVARKVWKCSERAKTCMHGPFLIEGVIWEFGHQNRKWRWTNSKVACKWKCSERVRAHDSPKHACTTKKISDQNFFRTKKIFGLTFFFGPKIFSDQKFFWTKNVFGPKLFLDQKNFGQIIFYNINKQTL